MEKDTEFFPFILASRSPRRRRILATLPWPFRVRVSSWREPRPPRNAVPGPWVRRLAWEKARRVAHRLPSALVLGADTIVWRNGRIWGKPSSRNSAKGILSDLAGKWHTVYTGLALVALSRGFEGTVVWKTRVKMRRFSAQQIDYWARRNHDKAGAYSAQTRGSPFVERIQGDFDNVVGLPRKGVRALVQKARRAGFRLCRRRLLSR